MKLLLPALLLALSVHAVKREDFKECGQTSFCRRLRPLSTKSESTDFASPYSLGAPSRASASQIGVPAKDAAWSFPLSSTMYPDVAFELRVDILEGDIARVRVDEVGSVSPWRRYNETAKWALLNAEPAHGAAEITTKNSVTSIRYGQDLTLRINHAPLRIAMVRGGNEEIVFNDRGLFHMEHFRAKEMPVEEEVVETEGEEVKTEEGQVVEGAEIKTEPEDQQPFEATIDRSWFETEDGDMFEEQWKRWRDSKPKGPEAFSLDISFPFAKHVFGLPEHASPLSLPDTIGEGSYYTEPYRLWNVDIFEYVADSPMALYGAVPLLHAHSARGTVGVLNLVASETWVDVAHTKGVQTHWISESGIMDLLLLPGPNPTSLFEQYAALTGPAQMPPQFATAYHQCRWNYNTQGEVIEVQDRFEEADMPLDVTWLDIEYADEHRYFDWNKKMFPDPIAMINQVAKLGRKMVAIVDPHIKRTDSFRVYKDSLDLDILIKKADGNNFDGWCWPGSSVWVDFFNPKSWEWWTRMFSFDTWADQTKNLFVWNDMNEPSVFDGPEITMPKDNIHDGGWEHRDVHNINGMLFHNQTQHAISVREPTKKRPFVLSRAYFAGSHRFGAIWTGDNLGTWEHMAGEAAMFLSNSIAGMSFVGSDIGGFFGNPGDEMLVRWYQKGAFMPFMRAHAHIDTKRREPYLSEEPIRSYLRDALRLRYTLLPAWYNAFHDAATKGHPVIWPHYAKYPGDETGAAVDNQYYIGDSGLLFRPVVVEGATSADVYLAAGEPYYDYFSSRMFPARMKPRNVTIDTPLDKFPLLIEGGHIFPSRERVRRSSALMSNDPFTLTVALGRNQNAEGQLYLDDGETFAWESGAFVHRGLEFKDGKLRSAPKVSYDAGNAYAQSISNVGVERVRVLGLNKEPKSVTVAGEEVQFEWDKGAPSAKEPRAAVLTIKNPGVKVVDDWEIVIA
ncbi:uncharacterized protein CcaverHIS019_0601500 [Cutaneotrichosporon cavernicola]|uniref:Glucosidase II subunit alpha n=1 Tax=Cutaneotrichosporon cavernicola TaxID=279322 RepID=A0AA48QXS4_9TREE|nr:uncharacterized protein CcaverHIS019_0601500 [Cutaneotrichosporon cavernicola]BEI93691.1 hypothetical protein CcaverHIS019_0601500 [Cutaneotrichosporon cavernicola]BEJ01468.1 hypothetical protein CcaverHIS631_0601500 [Cutaneotrichosporon cavernicola]BEJ09234.1 hypothetical protein CcaverHIS641_0601490 [Cutaneotrichosporon cavernicola]